jgi:hypothetical protein
VVRNTDQGSELTTMRWGMPPPPRNGGPPVTNIRNTTSPHWRGWLKPESRCLVPANSFAEYAPETNPETKKKDVVWFALNEDRPLFAFAGIWTGSLAGSPVIASHSFQDCSNWSSNRSPELKSEMAANIGLIANNLAQRTAGCGQAGGGRGTGIEPSPRKPT